MPFVEVIARIITARAARHATRFRELVPTHLERMLWGTLYSQGIEMQHIAREGRCWLIVQPEPLVQFELAHRDE